MLPVRAKMHLKLLRLMPPPQQRKPPAVPQGAHALSCLDTTSIPLELFHAAPALLLHCARAFLPSQHCTPRHVLGPPTPLAHSNERRQVKAKALVVVTHAMNPPTPWTAAQLNCFSAM